MMMNKNKERCEYWLPKKKRFCANTPLSNSSFCGNHSERSDGQWIACPIDPSHSVLEDNLDGHLKRCPLLKHSLSLQTQPFYLKGINAGIDLNDATIHNDSSFTDKTLPFDNVTSEMKRTAVYNMTVPQFAELIHKIKSIRSSFSFDIQDSYTIPEACSMWINTQADRKVPFQEKHILQQASILGNLEELGVLNRTVEKESKEDLKRSDQEGRIPTTPAVVEFGAGRGYLTQLLADCYGINKLFLVERKSYKLKADRSLRQKESLMLERLRIDIEDLNLDGVESLRALPFLAIGKHLCGPATDLTLRCCLREPYDQDNVTKQGASSYLRGLAIATCCHHLCQWRHYINKKFFSNFGITKDYFHAITWFTSWAVDADHGSDIADIMDSGRHSLSTKNDKFDKEASTVEDIVRSMETTERAFLGFMCKEIIDMGRLVWLKEHGLETQLVKYVPVSISPENRLLVAKRAIP